LIIIGERINATRKRIGKAVAERDEAFIAGEARAQAAAGATHIDCNAGRKPEREVEDLKWMIGVVQESVDLPLCIDSANAAAIAAGLKLVKRPPVINSVTAEKEKIASVMPLARDNESLLVALCMGDGGMPAGREDRLAAMQKILEAAAEHGVAEERLYFDPLIVPVSTNASEAMAAIETVRHMATQTKAHTTCGLSNISFGLPDRNVLNRTYLAMLMEAGLDGVIMDPTEPHMMATVLAARALLGRDEWCMEYIQAGRAGKLD
jgi:cobalamin-dependent methionine synthase I